MLTTLKVKSSDNVRCRPIVVLSATNRCQIIEIAIILSYLQNRTVSKHFVDMVLSWHFQLFRTLMLQVLATRLPAAATVLPV